MRSVFPEPHAAQFERDKACPTKPRHGGRAVHFLGLRMNIWGLTAVLTAERGP